MTEKISCVVLHTTKYGENSIIVDAFTLERGRASFVVRLPRSRKGGGLSAGVFMPLAVLELVCASDGRKGLPKVGEAHAAFPLCGLQTSAAKCALALFVAEVLRRALREGAADGALYEFVVAAVRWLDGATGPLGCFHLVFLVRLTRFLGFWPYAGDYVRGCWFDLRAGRFTALRPVHADVLGPDEAAAVETWVRLRFSDMHLLHLTREQRARCLEVILLYYRLHLPEFGVLNSVEVWHEVFA
jgi:DNA repair protein RecO (recombination protein O)